MKANHCNKATAGFSLVHALITGLLIAFGAVLFVFFQELLGWDSWISVPFSLAVILGGAWLLTLIFDALSQKGTVKVERDGKTYTATWWVEKGILTVSRAPGSREAPVRDSEPEDLARKVLSKMISSDKADARVPNKLYSTDR